MLGKIIFTNCAEDNEVICTEVVEAGIDNDGAYFKDVNGDFWLIKKTEGVNLSKEDFMQLMQDLAFKTIVICDYYIDMWDSDSEEEE